MKTFALDNHSSKFADLIEDLKLGKEILLTDHSTPIGKIVPFSIPQAQRAKAGIWKTLNGKCWMAPDFDAPLEDFRDYME